MYVEKPPQSRRDRLSGWASYTWSVADITSYGRQYPFDYDRRHAASVVGTVWLTARLDLSATLPVASGFPSTPAVGIRAVATPGAGGSLVPLKDAKGLYIWGIDFGGVENLNSVRLPRYARLDLRVAFNPMEVTGRWQVYAEILNALNRENASSLNYRLAADSRRPPASPLIQRQRVSPRALVRRAVSVLIVGGRRERGSPLQRDRCRSDGRVQFAVASQRSEWPVGVARQLPG